MHLLDLYVTAVVVVAVFFPQFQFTKKKQTRAIFFFRCETAKEIEDQKIKSEGMPPSRIVSLEGKSADRNGSKRYYQISAHNSLSHPGPARYFNQIICVRRANEFHL